MTKTPETIYDLTYTPCRLKMAQGQNQIGPPALACMHGRDSNREGTDFQTPFFGCKLPFELHFFFWFQLAQSASSSG